MFCKEFCCEDWNLTVTPNCDKFNLSSAYFTFALLSPLVAASTANSTAGAAMNSLTSLGTLQGLAGATVGLNNINALAGTVNSEYLLLWWTAFPNYQSRKTIHCKQMILFLMHLQTSWSSSVLGTPILETSRFTLLDLQGEVCWYPAKITFSCRTYGILKPLLCSQCRLWRSVLVVQ